MTPLLEAREIALDGRLRPTDLDLGPSEMMAVIGPNGSGKTSLLRALAHIDRSSGEVRIDKEDVSEVSSARRPHLLSFLPASRDVVWPISARDVVALGLPRPDEKRVDELIELMELKALAERPVDRLSTGERARVLFARAVAPNPRVLLLDEPLSNLDPYWVLRLIDILRQIVSERTSVLVTLHDIDRIDAFDRALLVGDGEIRADLPPSEMLRSKVLADTFRIEKSNSGWRVRRPADPRSSP